MLPDLIAGVTPTDVSSLPGTPVTISDTTAGDTQNPEDALIPFPGPFVGPSGWIRFDNPSTGEYDFTLSAQGYSAGDDFFAVVFSGPAGAATTDLVDEGAVAFRPDAGFAWFYGPVSGGGDVLTMDLDSSKIYYMYVGSNAGAGSGTFTFTISQSSFVGPPLNDDLANAQAIGPSNCDFVVGTTLGATAEFGEPDAFPGDPPTNTVWYKFTAPADCFMQFTVTSSDSGMANALLAVYDSWNSSYGFLGALVDQDAGASPSVGISLNFGQVCAVQIDTTSGGGAFTLTWEWVGNSPPVNDDFANAEVLSGTSGSTSGDTTGASPQCPTEPKDQVPLTPSGPFNTVWYKRVAANAKTVLLTFSVTSGSLDLEVWTGTTLTGLTLVTRINPGVPGSWSGANNKIVYAQVSGQTYYVRVQGRNGAESAFTLAWAECTAAAPTNDDFANAISITVPGSGNIIQSQQCATIEVNEQVPDQSQPALFTTWRTFTLTGSGVLVLTRNSGPSGVVNIFTGGDLAGLVFVDSLTSGTKTFYLDAGIYFLQFASQADRTNPSYWLPDYDINYSISEATSGTHVDITANTIGSYTRIDAWPTGLTGRGAWIRFLMTRTAGSFIHQGHAYDDFGNGSDTLLVARVVASDGLTTSSPVTIQGHITSVNEIQGATLVDGVASSEAYMGTAARSQTTALVEMHLGTVTDIRYIDIGMITGPSFDPGWSLTFSEIAWTDDPAVGPLGSPDITSRDVGWFAGWTDQDIHVPTTGSPSVTNTPPAGGPLFAVDCHLTGSGQKTFSPPFLGDQRLFSFSMALWVDQFPSKEVKIINLGTCGFISLDENGILSCQGDTAGSLSVNRWYDIEVVSDIANPSSDSVTLYVDGGPFTSELSGSTPKTAVTSCTVGLGAPVFGGNATSGRLFIGPAATGRTTKSAPLGTVTIAARPIVDVGTHFLPTDMNPVGQIRTFTSDGEIIYGGTPITTTHWSAAQAQSQGGGILAGTTGGHDATLGGNPAGSATVFAPDGTDFYLCMYDFFTWPVGTTVFFDFYLTGPAGKLAGMSSIGTFAQTLDASFASITCTGARLHVSGWCEVAFQDPGWDTQNTFNMHFPAGGDTYTIDTFTAYIAPSILPVYASSSTGGTGSSLITRIDGISNTFLRDNNDSTVVMLDRQGTWSLLAVIGDQTLTFPGFGAGSHHYFHEGTAYATIWYLEYVLATPVVAPAAAKLVARTGGYFNLDSTRVSASSRFAISVDGEEKSIGSLVSDVIAGGELIIPEPADPSTTWSFIKLVLTSLRMGYCDQDYSVDTPDSSEPTFLGLHAIGNSPDRTYHSPGNGGVVAFAQMEVLQLGPLGVYGPVSFW